MRKYNYQINDLAVINVQNEGFGESQEDEEEEDHLIDDEEEEVIFLDWTDLKNFVYFLIFFYQGSLLMFFFSKIHRFMSKLKRCLLHFINVSKIRCSEFSEYRFSWVLMLIEFWIECPPTF